MLRGYKSQDCQFDSSQRRNKKSQPVRELKHRGKTGTQNVAQMDLIGQPLFREFVAVKKIVLGPRFGITEVTRRNVRPKSGFTLILHKLMASPTRLGEILVQCSACDL